MNIFRFKRYAIIVFLIFHVFFFTEDQSFASEVVEYNNMIWQQIDDGEVYTIDEAKGYCGNLVLKGFENWRVPKVSELTSIYNCFDQDYEILNANQPGCPEFQRTTSFMYLAISDTNENEAWGVLDTDRTMPLSWLLAKDPEGAMSKPVRCVHAKGTKTNSGQTQYTISTVNSILLGAKHQQETLEEFPCEEKGLSGPESVVWKNQEWQRCDNGKKYTWDAGQKFCQNLTLNGQLDWRLPTILELRGLVLCTNGTSISMDTNRSTSCRGDNPVAEEEMSFDSPTIDPAFQCEPFAYWGEEYDGLSGVEMYVDFEDGFSFGSSKNDEHYIRCVRD